MSSFDADTHNPLWLERIRDGDPDAFRVLFRAFYPALCSYVNRYVGSAAVAEELVQEVFLSVWERRATLDPRSAVEGYLYRIARNRALNHVKHRRVVKNSQDLVIRTHVPPPTPEDHLHAAEFSDAAQTAIDELPPGAKRIFLLSREAGLSYREIAELLGISVKTVENQMGRALKGLRSALGPLLS